ncbi:hypothetical protein HDV00_005858 [Rhizophlyctis rosea]|nr:hypothetical protein HDV00_005858 [Rhizophlyctis rosea]
MQIKLFALLAATTLCAAQTTQDASASGSVDVNANVTWSALPVAFGSRASGDFNGTISQPPGHTDADRKNTTGTRGNVDISAWYRALTFKVKPQAVQVVSRLADHAQYRFVLSTQGGFPRMRAFFEQDGSTNDTEYVSTYMASLWRVAEVNGTYDWHNTTSYVDLTKKTNGVSLWGNFGASLLTSNGTSIIQTNTTYTDATTGFSLTLSAFVPQLKAKMFDASGYFQPNALKYSIAMSGFPFQYQNSHLVILQGLFTHSSDNVNNATNTTYNALATSTGNTFTWNATASVQVTANAAVVAAPITIDFKIITADNTSVWAQKPGDSGDSYGTETARLLAYHINATGLTPASKIIWDPELGVQTDMSSAGFRVKAGASVMASVVVAVLYGFVF